MKKLVIVLLCFFFFTPVTAYGADYEQQLDDIVQDYDIELLSDFSLSDIADMVAEYLKEQSCYPLKIFFRISAIMLIFSLSQALSNGATDVKVTDNICTLTVFITLLTPINSILTTVSENLFSVKNFMVTFLPVFSGITMASGEFTTSMVYSGFFLAAMTAVSQLCLNVIIPSVKLFVAIHISDTLSPHIRLESLGQFYVKAVKNLMKVSVSAICFMLTLQTTISQGKDTLAVKTGKILAGTAIPVIGSALQDAVSGVYAAMESIKGYAGAVGLSATVMIFIPSIIMLSVYWLCTQRLCVVGDILGASTINKCVNGFTQAIELILAVIFLYMIMLIFSITIMIALTNGV